MLQPSDLEKLNHSLNNLKVSNKEEKKDHDLSIKLKELECPFSWNLDLVKDFQHTISRIEDKLSGLVDDDLELTPWKIFVCNIVLCYEYGKMGNFDESMEKLQECELTLAQQKECSATALLMGKGLEHILLACKCHLLSMKNEKEEIDLILPKITLVSAMTDEDKACMYCMKGAYCAEYGYDGFIKSVEFIEKGLSFNGKCSEWHFLLGRSLGRIRRVERKAGLPDRRELEALENAAKLSDNPGFHILLAQAYRETARNIHFEKKMYTSQIKSLLDTLNKKAYDLIRKVILLNKSSTHLNARCAVGLIKLPRPWQDLDLAKICLLKAMKTDPNNPMVNHVAGTYYNYVKDYREALNYFAKAAAMGVYGADLDAIVLKKRMNKNYDPSADLLRCLKTYKEKPRMISTLCYLGSHFYSMKNVQKALEYWMQATEIDIQSDKLQFKPDRRMWDINLPINEIILMELFKLLKNSNTSKEEKAKYQDFISKYRKHFPDTVEKVEKM